MSDQTKLEAIEKKVTEARNLINEAKALAAEVGTEFTVEITGDFSSAPPSRTGKTPRPGTTAAAHSERRGTVANEKKEVLEQIEAKVKKAAELIEEAQKLARANKIPFRTGLIREMKFNEETEEYDLPFTDEDDYDEGYVTVEAGWSPSGLNC